MTRRPRSGVILRRFLAGESINDILWRYRQSTIQRDNIEQLIRDKLNCKRSKR